MPPGQAPRSRHHTPPWPNDGRSPDYPKPHEASCYLSRIQRRIPATAQPKEKSPKAGESPAAAGSQRRSENDVPTRKIAAVSSSNFRPVQTDRPAAGLLQHVRPALSIPLPSPPPPDLRDDLPP